MKADEAARLLREALSRIESPQPNPNGDASQVREVYWNLKRILDEFCQPRFDELAATAHAEFIHYLESLVNEARREEDEWRSRIMSWLNGAGDGEPKQVVTAQEIAEGALGIDLAKQDKALHLRLLRIMGGIRGWKRGVLRENTARIWAYRRTPERIPA